MAGQVCEPAVPLAFRRPDTCSSSKWNILRQAKRSRERFATNAPKPLICLFLIGFFDVKENIFTFTISFTEGTHMTMTLRNPNN